MDLRYLRSNLHVLLGLRLGIFDQVDFVPLYHVSALRSTFRYFASLIKRNLPEELLQRYLQENPILFHQFPSTRVLAEPKILTSHIADFAIVTPVKELLLIELERANIRLLKRDGDTAADLSHAFDQVRNWLHEIDEHRLAVLDSLNIDRDEVSVIRGIVIGGCDAGYDAKTLRKLKGMDLGRISFFTYDDLLFALDTFIHRIESL